MPALHPLLTRPALLALALLLLTAGCGGGGSRIGGLGEERPATGLGTVTGLVVSLPGGLPVAGAQVQASGVETTTGTDGRYSLEAVPAGTVLVIASTTGLGAALANLEVRQGAEVSANFVLNGGADNSTTGTGSGAQSSGGCDGSRGRLSNCGSRPSKFICNDGTISCAENRQGACSSHGGICSTL